MAKKKRDAASWTLEEKEAHALETLYMIKTCIDQGIDIDVMMQGSDDMHGMVRLVNDDGISLENYQGDELTMIISGKPILGEHGMKKQKDRVGKKSFTCHVPTDAYQAFKALAVEKDTTVQALIELAMDLVFERFGKPQITQSDATKAKLNT